MFVIIFACVSYVCCIMIGGAAGALTPATMEWQVNMINNSVYIWGLQKPKQSTRSISGIIERKLYISNSQAHIETALSSGTTG